MAVRSIPRSPVAISIIKPPSWAGGADSNVANGGVAGQFRFEKSADQDNATAGDRLYFSIAYENTGTAAATGAQIVGFLPATMTPVARNADPLSTARRITTWSRTRRTGENDDVSYAVTVDTNARAVRQ